MKEISELINKIHTAECLEFMKDMPENSMDLTVTSPPYDNLRDYKGYSFDFEGIAKELFRITKDGGVVVWVVNDQTKDFCESLTSFNQVIFFNKIGFNLLDTMIFYKTDYAPAYPSLKRYVNQFEFMFILSKRKPKTFNPIQKEKKGKSQGLKTYRQRDGSLKIKVLIDNGLKTKNASNVWEYKVGGNKSEHPAVFPEKLARDHITSWSNEGDIVLDPFNGSGTTTKIASLLNRQFIGIDISEEYCKIAEARLNKIKNKLF